MSPDDPQRRDRRDDAEPAELTVRVVSLGVTPFAGALDELVRTQTAPFAGVLDELVRTQMAPLAGVLDDFVRTQTAPFAGILDELGKAQAEPLRGLLDELAQVQITPLGAAFESLDLEQSGAFAGFAKQLRGASQWQALLRSTPLLGILLEEINGAADIVDLIGTLEPASLSVTTDVEIAAPVEGAELADWFRGVLATLLVFGGPVLVLQVLLITWAIAAEIGPDTRTKFVEWATLIGTAIALAPAFSSAASKVDPRRRKDE